MLNQNSRAVKRPALKFSSFPTVAEFLRINPLPHKLRHLEPALRKMPNVDMVFSTIIEQLKANAGEVGK